MGRRVFMPYRKLFVKSFLYGMRWMLFIVTGNFPFLCYNIRRY